MPTFDFDDWAKEFSPRYVEWERVYLRLQPHAARTLALAAGFPIYPPPVPYSTVRVRTEALCPACGQGRVSRHWSLGGRVLIAGSDCRHVFVMAPPLPFVSAGE
ncbi:hypothetical protein [Streptomyces sp. NPDC020965]|uniref:hypothetical protein n=1 Tax=Streptomyces sp. NPDC020965 TaxID=3365105 RepID=UPI00379555CB